ncbi:protein Shroom2-like [Clavelina lepadiformis]|uniref:protein Shroom2-like n=1 Tax=Clavelina lepadiformis TaxID=159417 RepID=UPI004042EF67
MAPRSNRLLYVSCPSSPGTLSPPGSPQWCQVAGLLQTSGTPYNETFSASSQNHYRSAASKAQILFHVQKNMTIDDVEENETHENIVDKKVELILRIKSKLEDLEYMKALLKVEMRENECLGKQIHEQAKRACTQRELEKYNILVQDIDKVINLRLSIIRRLACVDNTINMLSTSADEQEVRLLYQKRDKLNKQKEEAEELKLNSDKRQALVSSILAGHLDKEQFADFKHYIEMKSTLIAEQRELDEKFRLGEEQVRCLYDSLSEDWQLYIDQVTAEK